ncbi:MAG: hypothetical protein MUE40_20005, partial [Anaerolineae bacterium]|nr:hypothetical protein [Anaerolineae bacterium]
MDEFEFKGLWWLPQFPDHQVAGTLKFHPVDGAVLETLYDGLGNLIANLYGIHISSSVTVTVFPKDIVIDTIYGYDNKGDAVTLFQCNYYGSHSDIQVKVILMGCHFEKKEDLVFDSMTINYSHLEN